MNEYIPQFHTDRIKCGLLSWFINNSPLETKKEEANVDFSVLNEQANMLKGRWLKSPLNAQLPL